MSDHHESESEHVPGGCAQDGKSRERFSHEGRQYGGSRRGLAQSDAVWTWLAVTVFGLVSAVVLLPRPKSISIDDARSRKIGIVLQEIAEAEPVVPAEALARDREGVFVFVEDYERKNHFISAEVTVEPAGGGKMRIVQGLFPGDQIVVSGVGRLRLEQGIRPSAVSTKCHEPGAETNRHPVQETK